MVTNCSLKIWSIYGKCFFGRIIYCKWIKRRATQLTSSKATFEQNMKKLEGYISNVDRVSVQVDFSPLGYGVH